MGKVSLYSELTSIPQTATLAAEQSAVAKKMTVETLRPYMGYPTMPNTPSGECSFPGLIELGTVTANLCYTSQNIVNFCPFLLTAPITFTKLLIEVNTAQTTSSVFVAIYAANSTLSGGSLVTDWGGASFNTSTTGTKTITGLTTAFDPGMYLMAWCGSADGVGMRGTQRGLTEMSLMSTGGLHVNEIQDTAQAGAGTWSSTSTFSIVNPSSTPGIYCPIFAEW
jgi:hypothetical protein